MQRHKDSETVARFQYKRAEPEGEALRERAALFIGERKEEIEAAYGKVELDFISDRDAEAWSPLFALLAICGCFAARRVTRFRRAPHADQDLKRGGSILAVLSLPARNLARDGTRRSPYPDA
jgi:hypothetical protein